MHFCPVFDSMQRIDLVAVYITHSMVARCPCFCRYLIGEPGSLSIAVWSSVVVAGTRLLDLADDGCNEDWKELHHQVFESTNEILKLKGPTCWSCAMMCTKLVDCILKNQVSYSVI
jgi:malate/lactate dehydrogenase